MNKKIIYYLGVILIVHVWLSYEVSFTAWPEMITYPWLMEKGFLLYTDVILPYLPLLPWTLFIFFKVFGFSINNLHLFTIIWLGMIDIFIFMIIMKKNGIYPAIIGTLFFIITQFLLEGNGLWFDEFGILFILIAYFLVEFTKVFKGKYFLMGALIGLAFLVKQTYILFLIPLLKNYFPHYKKIISIIIAAFIPLGVVMTYFCINRQCQEFMYWSIWHPLFVHSRIPGFMLPPNRREIILTLLLFLPYLVIFFNKHTRLWIMGLILSSFLILPRFAYFHLIPALTFVSILLPEILKIKKIKMLTVMYLLLFFSLSAFFIIKSWQKPVRFFDPEVLKDRNRLAESLPTNSTIYFYNIPAHYFVMTPFTPIKPWADTFPWYLEVSGVQEQIIQSLHDTQYVVHTPFQNEGDFIPGTYKPKLINKYFQEHFSLQSMITPQLLLFKRVY